MRWWRVALLVAVLPALSSIAAADEPGRAVFSSDDPAMLTASLGAMGDELATDDTAAVFSLAYRAGPELELLYLRPFLGLLVSNEGSVYGWLGLSIDFFLGERFVLTPQIGAGAFSAGSGQSLGHVFQVRSGVVLACRFANHARVGLGVHHLSNEGLGKRNPGAETVGMYFSIPLKF